MLTHNIDFFSVPCICLPVSVCSAVSPDCQQSFCSSVCLPRLVCYPSVHLSFCKSAILNLVETIAVIKSATFPRQVQRRWWQLQLLPPLKTWSSNNSSQHNIKKPSSEKMPTPCLVLPLSHATLTAYSILCSCILSVFHRLTPPYLSVYDQLLVLPLLFSSVLFTPHSHLHLWPLTAQTAACPVPPLSVSCSLCLLCWLSPSAGFFFFLKSSKKTQLMF